MTHTARQMARPAYPGMSADALIDRILLLYHDTHRSELPGLIDLAHRVERIHADSANAPYGLADALDRFFTDLDNHMKAEEYILFPAIRQGLKEGLARTISSIRIDHGFLERTMASIRQATGDFKPPSGASGSWRQLYAGLAKLHADLVEHHAMEDLELLGRFVAAPSDQPL